MERRGAEGGWPRTHRSEERLNGQECPGGFWPLSRMTGIEGLQHALHETMSFGEITE